MNERLLDIFTVIKRRILEQFPTVNVELTHNKDSIEYFFCIDDKNIYNSESFQLLITKLSIEVIWPEHIPNIHFTYEEQQNINSLTMNFSQLLDRNLSLSYENKLENFVVNSYSYVPEEHIQAA